MIAQIFKSDKAFGTWIALLKRDLVAAKLVPAAALLDPPHLVALPVSSDDEAGFQQISKAPRAYWPAAPPDRSAAGLTGAARTLAYHSHLRI